ncbi:hypothetical protein HUU39_07290 [candidate division KSB1 bacterium]|nr:hypothetical protein [bacterium]NUM65068.1 hypothetical protein [candidate division KSB1 bacterium]
MHSSSTPGAGLVDVVVAREKPGNIRLQKNQIGASAMTLDIFFLLRSTQELLQIIALRTQVIFQSGSRFPFHGLFFPLASSGGH